MAHVGKGLLVSFLKKKILLLSLLNWYFWGHTYKLHSYSHHFIEYQIKKINKMNWIESKLSKLLYLLKNLIENFDFVEAHWIDGVWQLLIVCWSTVIFIVWNNFFPPFPKHLVWKKIYSHNKMFYQTLLSRVIFSPQMLTSF